MNNEIFESEGSGKPKKITDRLKKQYPFFLRTTPSFISFNHAKMELLKYFNWKKVAIVYEYSSILHFMVRSIIN